MCVHLIFYLRAIANDYQICDSSILHRDWWKSGCDWTSLTSGSLLIILKPFPLRWLDDCQDAITKLVLRLNNEVALYWHASGECIIHHSKTRNYLSPRNMRRFHMLVELLSLLNPYFPFTISVIWSLCRFAYIIRSILKIVKELLLVKWNSRGYFADHYNLNFFEWRINLSYPHIRKKGVPYSYRTDNNRIQSPSTFSNPWVLYRLIIRFSKKNITGWICFNRF